MDTHTSAYRLHDVCAAAAGVLLAYLFGSQVEGVVGPISDVDVAVLLEDAADPLAMRAHLAHAIRGAVHAERVDVVILNEAPIELAYAVIARGKLVFAVSEAVRVEYEATVMSRYGDYLPVLRAFRSDIVKGDDYGHRVQRYRAALRRFERAAGQATPSRRQSAG